MLFQQRIVHRRPIAARAHRLARGSQGHGAVFARPEKDNTVADNEADDYSLKNRGAGNKAFIATLQEKEPHRNAGYIQQMREDGPWPATLNTFCRYGGKQ